MRVAGSHDDDIPAVIRGEGQEPGQDRGRGTGGPDRVAGDDRGAAQRPVGQDASLGEEERLVGPQHERRQRVGPVPGDELRRPAVCRRIVAVAGPGRGHERAQAERRGDDGRAAEDVQEQAPVALDRGRRVALGQAPGHAGRLERRGAEVLRDPAGEHPRQRARVEAEQRDADGRGGRRRPARPGTGPRPPQAEPDDRRRPERDDRLLDVEPLDGVDDGDGAQERHRPASGPALALQEGGAQREQPEPGQRARDVGDRLDPGRLDRVQHPGPRRQVRGHRRGDRHRGGQRGDEGGRHPPRGGAVRARHGAGRPVAGRTGVADHRLASCSMCGSWRRQRPQSCPPR